MNEFDGSDFFDEPDDDEEKPRDEAIDEAKPFLMFDLFDAHPEGVYYERQIEVIYEKRFFHWIIAKALHELRDERKINSALLPLTGQVRIRFYWSKTNRYWKRDAERIRKLVAEYSAPQFTKAIGDHGETMFDAALPTAGFMPKGKKVREYNGRKWTKSGHDLDRIFERDGIIYGIEIKNTLDYLPHFELQTKIQMCETLKIRPLFIARMLPKNYIKEVSDAGGFCLIFKYQLYPHGSKSFAQLIQGELGLPVDSPKAIETGTITRLLNWHLKKQKKV